MKRASSVSFGTSKRTDFTRGGEETPGAKYNIDPKLNPVTKGAPLVGKAKNKKPTETPAPNNYEIKTSALTRWKKGFSASMGRGPRLVGPKNNSPSPAEYLLKQIFDKKGGAMTRSKRRSSQLSSSLLATPGPGHYKIPVKVANIPKYALTEQDEKFKFV